YSEYGEFPIDALRHFTEGYDLGRRCRSGQPESPALFSRPCQWGVMLIHREDGMPYDPTLSRRALLHGAAVTAAGLCAATVPVRAASETVVGFIYVGPRDDFGYNQAHAQGAVAVTKLSGVKVVEEEKVPETADVQKTMGSMITLDGAMLLFPT